MPNTLVTLETRDQRLRLMPTLGAGIASWKIHEAQTWQPMLRAWDGVSEDRYTFAYFPLVPWSNRIGGGGFTQDAMFYPVRPNRAGEPYPIHGDGRLQPWTVSAQGAQHGMPGRPGLNVLKKGGFMTLEMTLRASGTSVQ